MNKFDPQGMYKIYDMWPTIARDSYTSDYKKINFGETNHIVFAGMGGSGTLGDLFFSVLSKTNIHVSVVKGYSLPKTVNSNTLVVVTSISGNTQEAVSTLKSAHKLNSKIIAFASGGSIEHYCKKNNLHFFNISQIHSPRTSFIKYVYSMLKVLDNIMPISQQDIIESLDTLDHLSNQISSNNINEKNPSFNLANWISGIPLIYYPYGLRAAAIRFKNSLQENTKLHAMVEDVIEACHNNIVSWEQMSTIQPILIEGQDDHVKTKERWEIVKEYFVENDIDFKEIHSVSGNILTKMTTLIYLLDYTSIYRAVLSKTDPSPVSSIDYVKSRL